MVFGYHILISIDSDDFISPYSLIIAPVGSRSVFYDISKHLEARQKAFATYDSNLHTLNGSWQCGKTQPLINNNKIIIIIKISMVQIIKMIENIKKKV